MGDFLRKIGILTAIIAGTVVLSITLSLGYTTGRIFSTLIILGSMAFIFADELSETGFFVGLQYVNRSSPGIVLKIFGVILWIIGSVILIVDLSAGTG